MNSRRSFIKALPLVPAALAGAAAVAKAAPKLDLDEMFDLAYKIKQERASALMYAYWHKGERYVSYYSREYLESLKQWDGRGIQFY